MQGEESSIKNLNPTERSLDSKTVKGLVEVLYQKYLRLRKVQEFYILQLMKYWL